MKETIYSFKRYEKKYLLTPEACGRLMERLAPHLVPDAYHRSTVRSIYYDWDDYRLIRHSLDKPLYKEKLRLRSYKRPTPESEVFVELKKKYKGVVYKRRVASTEEAAMRWLARETPPPKDSQMAREIDWFLHENSPKPKVLIACDRTAWVDREDPNLRVTFDEAIRWRGDDLLLSHGSAGELLLPDGEILMELKLPEAAPLWLAHLLGEEQIYPTGFSKYGVCYRKNLLHSFIIS